MKKKQYTQDMTQGSVVGHLLRFSLPLLAGYAFQELYNMVDAIIVGRYVGTNALAAVGLVGSITHLFFALSIGLGGGIGILVSQYFGARREYDVKVAVANSVYLTFASGILMGILGVILSKPILRLMNTPGESMNDAVIYMCIVCGCAIITAGYGMISSIMRALGDSKTPLLFLIVSSLINIALDLLFVLLFDMGVAGVAWATVIAQLIATVGSVIYGYHTNTYLRPAKTHFKASKTIITKSIKLGIPLACQNAMGALSGMASQTAINGFGSAVIAGNIAVKKAVIFMALPFSVLGVACSNFVAQNAGAGKYERIRESCYKSMLMVMLYSLVMILVNQLFSIPIAQIFVTEPKVVEIGALGLQITGWMFLPLGMTDVMRATLNGAGDTMFTMVNGIFEVVASVIFIYVLTSIPAFGMKGIWYSNGVVWTLVGLMNFMRVRSGKWKKEIIQA